MQEHPVIKLHERAVNVRAIRAYWLVVDRSVHECEPDLAMQAVLTYLVDTDRLTEKDATGHRFDKPVTIYPFQRACGLARLEDGDQTLWSDPPKTWLKEN